MRTGASTDPRGLEERVAAAKRRLAAKRDDDKRDDHRRAESPLRNVLVIKGLSFGLPDAKIGEAFKAARDRIIGAPNITTIVWDGDPLGYVGPKGEPPPSSMTRVIEMLGLTFPWLEFLFFKKRKSVDKQFADITPMYLDDASLRSGVTQYVGPLPFITSTNTKILNTKSALPPRVVGRHYAIAMPDDVSWNELGLRGLQYLKSNGNVHSLHYMVVGNPGHALRQELTTLNAAKEAGTFDALFPQLTMINIEYERPQGKASASTSSKGGRTKRSPTSIHERIALAKQRLRARR